MLFLWLAMTLIAFCRQGPSFSQCFLNAYEAQLLTKHNSVSLRERLPNGSPCPPYHNRASERASEAWAVARRHFHCLSLLFLTESESEGGTLQRIQGRQIATTQPSQKFMDEASRENKCASQTTSWPTDCLCRPPRPRPSPLPPPVIVCLWRKHIVDSISWTTPERVGDKRERRAAAPN